MKAACEQYSILLLTDTASLDQGVWRQIVCESCHVSAVCRDQSFSPGQLSITKTCWQRRHVLTAAVLVLDLWEVKLTNDSMHRLSFIYSKVPYWTCDRPPHQGDFVVTFLTLWVFLSFFRWRSLQSTWIPTLMAELTSKISVMECLQSKVRGRFSSEQYFMSINTTDESDCIRWKAF